MTTQTYQEASRTLLAQAEAELGLGDVRQASEKGWGAAAQMLKAVAQQRGWAHQSHAALYRTISRLVSETGDDEIRRLFHVAGSLHTNFYENPQTMWPPAWPTSDGSWTNWRRSRKAGQ